MNNEFGQFLTKLRKDRHITIRKLADGLGVSCGYINDVEKGRRFPLNADRLRLVVQVLALGNTEKYTLFDLAVQERKDVPADIVEYLNNNPIAKKAIRFASIKNLGEDDWQKFVDIMNEEVKDNAS